MPLEKLQLLSEFSSRTFIAPQAALGAVLTQGAAPGLGLGLPRDDE